MAKKTRYNFTEEQKKLIMEMYHCMREAYWETVYEYIKEGRAIVERDRFGRLVCTILPERT